MLAHRPFGLCADSRGEKAGIDKGTRLREKEHDRELYRVFNEPANSELLDAGQSIQALQRNLSRIGYLGGCER